MDAAEEAVSHAMTATDSTVAYRSTRVRRFITDLAEQGYMLVETKPEPEPEPRREHVFLVAVSVTTGGAIRDRGEAERWLHARLNEPTFRANGPHRGHTATYVDSWHIAEDDRQDMSDADSAVFVPGSEVMTQEYARDLLNAAAKVLLETSVTNAQLLRLVQAAVFMADEDPS